MGDTDAGQRLIAQGPDWCYLKELKRELKR
jgi:hypothetical protein